LLYQSRGQDKAIKIAHIGFSLIVGVIDTEGVGLSKFRSSVEAWAHAAVDVWERVYRVLKGLPHHRLAMVTVSVGAVIISGPFWEPYIRAIVEKAFEVRIDVPAGPIWGAALITLGLGYHLAMTWMAANEKTASAARDSQIEDRIRGHDAPIFHRFLAEAPEHPFKKALSDLANDHAYTSTQSALIAGTYYFLDMIGNKFNDVTVQEKASTLEKCLDELTVFTGEHFSVYGPMLQGDALRFCMEPQWNIDRGGSPTREESIKYDALGRRLTQMVRATGAAYEDLLRTGHLRLL